MNEEQLSTLNMLVEPVEKYFEEKGTGMNVYVEICPEMHANEIHELYDRHHKVSPNLNSH